MTPVASNWWVVTGVPSAGKSTVIDALARLGHRTVPEAARRYLDEQRGMGRSMISVRADPRRLQRAVLERQLEAQSDVSPRDLVFFDRGIPDTLAYYWLHGLVADECVETASAGTAYRGIFMLEPLPTYSNDYARLESEAESHMLEEHLVRAYRLAGHEPVRVPAATVEERVSCITGYVRERMI